MAKTTPSPEPEETTEAVAQEPETAQPSEQAPAVKQVQFAPIGPADDTKHGNPMDLILNVEVQATVELGRANLQVRDVLDLGPGSVVELEKLAGEPVDVMVNNRPFARGEVVVIDEYFGVRLTEIISPTERIATLA